MTTDYAKTINEGGLLLLGCGKMGSAMLRGWLGAGVRADAVTAIDPHPSDWLQSIESEGLQLNPTEPRRPKVCILAVKPQMMGEAAPTIASFGNGHTPVRIDCRRHHHRDDAKAAWSRDTDRPLHAEHTGRRGTRNYRFDRQRQCFGGDVELAETCCRRLQRPCVLRKKRNWTRLPRFPDPDRPTCSI